MRDRLALAIISGPTGIGKTSISLKIAQKLNAEIVNADSVQVYRYMNIGSAKPTIDEQSTIRHHLIDVVDPDEPFDAARYRDSALEACKDIIKRGKRVLVVGGTGLYIKALVWGLFNAPKASLQIREHLRRIAKQEGPAKFHQRLFKIDPGAAERIHPNDTYRIIRALEVYEQTGRSISTFPAISSECTKSGQTHTMRIS